MYSQGCLVLVLIFRNRGVYNKCIIKYEVSIVLIQKNDTVTLIKEFKTSYPVLPLLILQESDVVFPLQSGGGYVRGLSLLVIIIRL